MPVLDLSLNTNINTNFDLDLDFLSASPCPDAELVVMLPDGTVSRIRHVSTSRIREACPLLYYAFEEGIHCPHQASIEVTSIEVVTSFLRFLYTGDYLRAYQEAHQCSLLLHAELCKMGEDFHVSELQVSAYVNFMRATEVSCSFPKPPLGLCEATTFIYRHLVDQPGRQQQSLIDALLNYCVFSFKYHGLGDHPSFRQIVYDTPIFHKHLCETSMSRAFQDDGAAEIICLPVSRPIPHSHHSLLHHDSEDFHIDSFCEADDITENRNKHPENPFAGAPYSEVQDAPKLAFRPKRDQGLAPLSDSDSSSDEDGYTLLYRPKIVSGLQSVSHSTGDYLASPELTSTTPSEDEWTFEALSADEKTKLLLDSAKTTLDTRGTFEIDMKDLTDDDWALI